VGRSWYLHANVPNRRRGQAGVSADFKRLSPHRREQRRVVVTVTVTDGAPDRRGW
jgi:hypothetical protein